ncbi:MAG TPA: outer membrane beta-barrel domain-containing protein [Myxococcota bacterium]|nr:outer membrane beta-barrel domain-containing protein [Myxococcota bacterium]HRY95168.1 outer membrane beta-barrel domain-containing protein [Myxococcota bacterium]HSA20911.1 outer membrane beta-barrel domain-containing protein [Myxococcota bacterium]
MSRVLAARGLPLWLALAWVFALAGRPGPARAEEPGASGEEEQQDAAEEEEAAEDEEEEEEADEGGAPKDKSIYGPIQKRLYALDNELSIGFSYLPLDPYTKGYGAHLAYTIHFDDLWALELLRVGFSWNVDTSLKTKVIDAMPQATPEEFPAVVFYENTNLILKLLYGKQSGLNAAVLHYDLFLLAGAALLYRNPFNLDQIDTDHSRFDLGFNLGVGFRFWLSPDWSLRVDLRDTLIVFGVNNLDWPLENSVEVSLALSVNL